MPVRMRVGQQLSTEVVTMLDGLIAKADDLRSNVVLGYEHQYALWHSDSENQLRSWFSSETIESVLHSRRHWAITGGTDPPAVGHLLIQQELREIIDRLSQVRAAAASHLKRWTGGQHLVVVDTNIFLHNPTDQIENIDWHTELGPFIEDGVDPEHVIRLIVLIAVVDELDRLKRDQRSRTRARSTLKQLDEFFVLQVKRHVAVASRVVIELVLDDLGHQRLPEVDGEIIDRSLVVQEFSGRGVVLMTADTAMGFRARAAGLTVAKVDYPDP